MTKDEFRQYWMPARDQFDGEINLHRSKKLASLLGLPYPKMAAWGNIKLTDQLKHQLKMLAGPHRDTIIRMMELKREMQL